MWAEALSVDPQLTPVCGASACVATLTFDAGAAKAAGMTLVP